MTQQLGRLGFRLHIAPNLNLTTGYVLAANEYGSGDNKRAPEHRFYQEIALADASGPVRASHRLRAEERWLRPAPKMVFGLPRACAISYGWWCRYGRTATGGRLVFGGRR